MLEGPLFIARVMSSSARETRSPALMETVPRGTLMLRSASSPNLSATFLIDSASMDAMHPLPNCEMS